METTVPQEPLAARPTWLVLGRGGGRKRGRTWPAVGVTLGVSLAAFALRQLARTSKKPMARLIRVGAPALAVGSWVYLLYLRRWHLRWGATGAELRRAMPGDELVPDPDLDTTRAITVEAPPEALWPWLAQMGHRRGGWYSYDWIDNLGVPSARRIIPELQNLKVGDLLTPVKEWFSVASLDPQRSLVLVSHDKKGRITTSWTFLLEPLEGGRTRFIERLRLSFGRDLAGLFWYFITETADFVMMRKQMLNLKRRAEQASEAAVSVARA
ncbi:MAG: SRPBCC family protein [Myxococcaceae bacterium]|nr:SRPBCC family protein [Myxococcaceae bacterium]